MTSIAGPEAVDATVRETLWREGFLSIDRLVDDATVAHLRQAYDEILDRTVVARGDRLLGGIIRQVKNPAKDHPVFRANAAIDAGIRLANALFERDGLGKVYEMLIDKPAGTEHETPWHQDVGYLGKPVAPAGSRTGIPDIQIWLALDPVDEANGCMQFVPRPHRAPSLAHAVAVGDPEDEGRLLAIDEPLDTSTAVACPLAAGGCTVHLIGTPHRTGPNLTDRPRRAYIFNIGPIAMAAASEQALREEWGDSARL